MFELGFSKQKLLYGWMTRQKVADYLMQCSREDQERLGLVLSKWDAAYSRRLSLVKDEASAADSVGIFDVDDEFKEELELLKQKPGFRNSFNNVSTEFKMVEIDKLVTHTVSVYLDSVEKFLAEYRQRPSPQQLIDICLPLTKNTSDCSRLRVDQFNYVYSSNDLDFRLIDVIPKPVAELGLSEISEGLPVRALVMLFGFGFPMVKVVRVGKRLVLDNGFHRLYSLRSLGVKHVPAVVTNDASGVSKYLPLDYVANSPRPPLFKDFFDPELTVEVSQQKKKRVVKISILPEVIDVPL